MISTRFVAVLALISLNAVGAMAQETSSERDAREQSIVNDKTGRYVSIDTEGTEITWHAAKICNGRPTRIVFVRIGQSLFRIPRAKIHSIGTVLLARVKLSEDRYRHYHPASAGCRETPIDAFSIDILRDHSDRSISLWKRDPPSPAAPISGDYDCGRSLEFETCLTLAGHARVWRALDPTATTRSGDRLGYSCELGDLCGLGDIISDEVRFGFSFRKKERYLSLAELKRLYEIGYAAANQFRVEN